jgi:hypothetical protein
MGSAPWPTPLSGRGNKALLSQLNFAGFPWGSVLTLARQNQIVAVPSRRNDTTIIAQSGDCRNLAPCGILQ